MRPLRSPLVSTLGLAALLIAACSTSPEDNPVGPGIPGAVVRTDHDATVQHADGWAISVPLGAVPLNKDGDTGEMLFSIDVADLAALGLPATPPGGWTMVGDAVIFGPEWFVLAQPVTVTAPIPVSVDLGTTDACLFAYERPLARWIALGGRTDADARLMKADLMRLGPHVLMTRPVGPQAWGAIAVDGIDDYQFVISVESAQIGYYPEDGDFDRAWCHARIAPPDDPLSPAEGRFFLEVPQGIYRLAIGAFGSPDPRVAMPAYLGYGECTVTLGEPHYDWTRPDHEDHAQAVELDDLARWTDPANLSPGTQPAVPAPTASVGIGELNVRLEWAAAADLDLVVVDPCGNRIWGGAVEATCNDAVGRLDLDNQCSRLVPGKPENVFWDAPPRGEYTVYADYFEDCGGAGRLFYTVRWMVGGAVYARHGFLLPPEWAGVVGDEVKLAEFTY